MTKEATPEIGFVVIGRNEGARLEKCLRSVLSVSKRVAYADSASSDGSAELAERLGALTVRLPADPKLNAARGRNAGYKALRTRFPECRFVQFLDGDCILQPDWVDQALAFLESHPEVAVVCGRRFEAFPQASIYNSICDDEWNTPIGEATECGGDAMMRCEAVNEVDGYRPELQAGEEPEMTARMRAAGWKIWRIDARMTEHDVNMHSLRQWWLRAQRSGYGYAQVWYATASLSQRLYGRQLRSALAWTFLPIAVIAVAAVARQPLILFAIPFLYLFQLTRIATRARGNRKWTRAGLILLAKIPEAIGAARFVVTGGARQLPEYKT